MTRTITTGTIEADRNPWTAVRVATVLAIVTFLGTVPFGIGPDRSPDVYWPLVWAGSLIVSGILLYLVFWWNPVHPRPGPALSSFGLVFAAGLHWIAVAVGRPESLVDFYPTIAASVLALVLLVYRGAAVLAWASVLTIGAVGVFAGPIIGITGWIGAAFPVAMGATFFAVSAAALVLRGMLGEIMDLIDQRSRTRSRTSRAREARGRREARIERLNQAVGPILARVAAGEQLSADDLREVRLIELGLRDGIRGAVLDVPEIVDAARGARERGVQVTLLDDGGLATVAAWQRDMVLETIVPLVVSELRSLRAGELVVRVLPPAREIAALVTVTFGDHRTRRVQVGWDGLTAPVR